MVKLVYVYVLSSPPGVGTGGKSGVSRTSSVAVNVVAPAVIGTEMLADVTEEQIGYMLSKIPMGRMGTVEEIAGLVSWLSSEECSYSTGAVYDLSGGRATY